MDRFAYSSEAYRFELGRRNDLNGAVSTPTGLVSIFVAAIGTFIAEWPEETDAIAIWLICGTLAASVAASATIVFLVRAYHNYPYQYAPGLQETEAWRATIIAAGMPPADADALLQDRLIEAFAAATQINIANNEAKSGYLFRATRCLVACLVALALSGPAYLIAKRSNADLKAAHEKPIHIIIDRSADDARARPAATPGNRPAHSAVPAEPGRAGERGSARKPAGHAPPLTTTAR